MKKVLVTMLLTANLVGCGMAEDLTKACGGSMDQMCDMLFGQDPENVEQLRQDVEALNERLDQLEVLLDHNISTINFISNQSSDNSTSVDTLQLQTNSMLVQLSVLEGYNNIVDFIDPCGDGSGYDEILLKTSDGSYVGYFQQGNGNNQKRFLTVLTDGNYQTTDQQQCQFSIVNGQYQE